MTKLSLTIKQNIFPGALYFLGIIPVGILTLGILFIAGEMLNNFYSIIPFAVSDFFMPGANDYDGKVTLIFVAFASVCIFPIMTILVSRSVSPSVFQGDIFGQSMKTAHLRQSIFFYISLLIITVPVLEIVFQIIEVRSIAEYQEQLWHLPLLTFEVVAVIAILANIITLFALRSLKKRKIN